MKEKFLYIMFSLGTVLFMSGCQNAYSQFYQPYLQKKLEPTSHVQYFTYKDYAEVKNMMSKGYEVIGRSGFTTVSAPTQKAAIQQAKKVGADIVMVTWKFQNSESQTIPIMNYKSGTTSTTYSNANVYGNNGYSAYGYGTSTTYTPGTFSTNYIQRTAHRYSYEAYYLKAFDIKKLSLGVQFGNKTSEINKKIGTNAGCPIQLVYENTPAYYNDLIDGDIILNINQKKVLSCQELNQELKNHKVVSFNIWRNGNIIEINDIKLNK